MTMTPPSTQATAYIWIAEPTEPSLAADLLTATNTSHEPPPISPVHGAARAGLNASLYGPWRLLGTTRATVLRDVYGDSVLKMWISPMYGKEVDLVDVISNHWFEVA
jgi:hypothetical protein